MKSILILGALLTMSLELFAAPPQPNIVFFLVDDLGYADVGFNGGKDIKTPNIDKLAREGTILGSHYVQPVCSPTRSALMTGRYPTHTGVYTIVRPHATWGLPLEERTLASALKEVGYETALTGKWHLGEFESAYTPNARGFDHQYGHYFGMIDYFTHTRGNSSDWYRDGKELKEEGYSTHLITSEACRIIQQKEKAKPLFLYVPFNGVHSPYQVPETYLQPYDGLKANRRSLAGMLAVVDEAIGKVVTTLESTGLRENTLIIFSSDNGGPSPGKVSDNGPLRAGKGTIYEGGVRVCAFANWPGHIPSGVTNNEPMHAVDWFPTLVKLAGGSLEQKLPRDGLDVWPMLTQGAKSPHEVILSASAPTRAAVRMGDWKLLLNASEQDSEEAAEGAPGKRKNKAASPAEKLELYNLATDIGESINLATKEPERVATMRAQLNALLKDAAPQGQLGNEEAAIKPSGKSK
ncbi:hypothetical protein BH11VER1_BH11VER1_30820 [soil metagenome]